MGFLTGWNNRIKLTIDASKIDADLTNFPVPIVLSASAGIGDQDLTGVFNEISADANRKKIAVTTDDGETQCYVEIEHWNTASKKAALHVKVPSILNLTDTILYLYYDSAQADNTTYVGDTGAAAAQSVWDSSFKAVYHLAQDPSGGAGAIKDSTSNAHNGTSAGTMLTEDLVDAIFGKGLDFDGTDDCIEFSNHADFSPGSVHAIEAVFQTTKNYAALSGGIFGDYGVDTDDLNAIRIFSDNKAVGYYRDSGADSITASGNGNVINDGGWHHMSFVRTALTTGRMDLDGATIQSPSNASTGAIDTSGGAGPHIGCWDSGGGNVGPFDGIISEVRVSNTNRSAAWNKATYHGFLDSLITFETPWLDGWWKSTAKRFKLVIDSSKVDSDLTNFPATIILDASCGLGALDATTIFDTLNSLSADDTFPGADSDPWNSLKWRALMAVAGTGGGIADIQGNEGRLKILATKYGNHLVYQWAKLTGDFDIQVDFTSISGQVDSDQLMGLVLCEGLTTTLGDYAWGAMVRRYASATGYFRFRYDDNGANNSYTEVTTSQTSGKLRLVRSGSTLSGYYHNGSNWVQVGTGQAWVSTDVYFGLYGYRVGVTTTSDYYFDFDNFTLNSGTLIWPINEFPNRKKIAITKADGITQQYVEIEQWDHENESAVLHTKCPSVLSASDTILYLYFDPDQTENTTYVGDPTSVPGQSVWDANFLRVYHLREDPTGGANAIKESTSSAGHLTGANMESADLIDAQVGKGHAFDGVDERDYNATAPITGTGARSVEVIGRVPSTMVGLGAFVMWGNHINNYQKCNLRVDGAGGSGYLRAEYTNAAKQGVIALNDNAWRHLALTLAAAANAFTTLLYVNGALDSGATNVGVDGAINTGSDYGVNLGYQRATTNDYYQKCDIGEVRISNTQRNAAWLKATYNTLFDSLITFTLETIVVDVNVAVTTPSMAWSVNGVEVHVGVAVTTPQMAWSVFAIGIVQNWWAYNVIRKPVVTSKQPGATVSSKQLTATATSKGPSATAIGED